MKKIKLLIYSLGILFLVVVTTRYFVRIPSYTIQTNGKLYIVNKASRDIEVFDLLHGKEIAEFPIDIESHQAATLSGSNRVVVANYGTNQIVRKSITVINTKNNTVEKTIELAKGYSGLDGIVAFPESNKIGLISYISNDLLVVNIETKLVEKKIPTQQKGSHFFVLHPFKPLAYVTNNHSGSISVIDLNIDKVIKIIPCGLGTQGIDITPDGSEIWVTNENENSIVIISTTNNQVINTLRSGKDPLKLKFSNDGKYCLVANAMDGTISVYNQKSKKKIKTISLHGKKTLLERILYHTPRPVNILMHPNGLYAFVSNSNANKIEVIDMKTFTIVSTIGTGKVPDGMAFVE
ncbi:YncE family protein [Flavobacterium frigoris]|uniref:40-residue YVTN family beta-propeller repeat-containing protein n=1 Tax=Flavobacterium frigoris TaxID=229204 RepID=A0A1H9CE52_FLAFI|nr:YncE family protein [Flavobacterium frigoris]SEP99424.1 40-residue YVTN family beta-propeller repeat-containing protein [Flavobacterium frigoris]